jgi:hypothetical protein
LGLLAFDAPWSAGLLLHGVWMGSLAIGVIRLVQPLRGGRTVNTARRLYGNQTANKVRAAFADRGIL